MTSDPEGRRPDDPRDGRVALRRDLLAEGWTDALILSALRRRELVRVRHGAFVAHDLWHSLDEVGRHELVARSVLARAGTDSVLSHATSLVLGGGPTWGLDLSAVHVTREDRRGGRAEAGVRQHRGLLLPDDVHVLRGSRVTTPTRAALETMTMLDVESSLVQVNDLLHRGLTTTARMRDRLDRGMAGWPGSLASDLVLRLADGRIESVAETRFFHLCWRAGLPKPTPQFTVRDEQGNVIAVLDFAWPERRLFVEIDGREKYVKPYRATDRPVDVVLRERRRENDVRRLTQWSGLRYGWGDLDRPTATAAELRRYLSGDDPQGSRAA